MLFYFDSHELVVNTERNRVDGCSLDKFLTLDAWNSIYLKLEPYIEKYTEKKVRRDATIEMRKFQLSLEVAWKKTEEHHKNVFADFDLKTHPDDEILVHKHVMLIKVKPRSIIEEYRKQRGLVQRTAESDLASPSSQSNESTHRKPSSSAAVKTEDEKPPTVNTNDEEYIPQGNLNALLEYTPSTVSAAQANVSPVDEYTPMPQQNPENGNKIQASLYSPSRINKVVSSQDQNRSESPPTFAKRPLSEVSTLKDVNRNEYISDSKRIKPSSSKNSQLDRSKELFGSDEDDVEFKSLKTVEGARTPIITRRLNLERQAKLASPSIDPNEDEVPGTEKKQSRLTDWISSKHRSLKLEDTPKAGNTAKAVLPMPRVSKGAAMNITTRKRHNERDENNKPSTSYDLAALTKMAETLEEYNQPIENDRIMYVYGFWFLIFICLIEKSLFYIFRNLHSMTPTELVETFPTYEETLATYYQKFADKPNHRVILAKDYDLVNLLNQLITSDQQPEMIRKLNDHFSPNKNMGITPLNNKLFWELMMPEWALLLFIDKFDLGSREEAIKVINRQVRAKMNPKIDDDCDLTMSFSNFPKSLHKSKN